MSTQLSSKIQWHFTTALQGQVSRYGILGNDFYKQFLPAGIEIEGRFPPRRISQAAYDLARRVRSGQA